MCEQIVKLKFSEAIWGLKNFAELFIILTAIKLLCPPPKGWGHIVFGADLVDVGISVGVGVGVGVTLSCLHDIS